MGDEDTGLDGTLEMAAARVELELSLGADVYPREALPMTKAEQMV